MSDGRLKSRSAYVDAGGVTRTVVVPAGVPAAAVTRVAAAPDERRAVIPVQPREVPAASVLAVQLASADAETVRRLQAEIDALRASLRAG
jgi:hypothetical protein